MEEMAETNYVVLDKLNLCKPSENKYNNNFLIAIKSAPTNRERRNALRQTWLIEAIERRIPYMFVIGNTKNQQVMEELLVEDETYNDLLIGKPIDNYYNLTLKVMFLLAWAKNYCPTHWLLYIDDDTILNVENAISFVATNKNEINHVIYCRIMDVTVIRQPNSPWFVPMSVWPFPHYPSYCSGNGYLIPSKTLSLLHQVATHELMQPKLWIDDVFITGIVANAVQIKLIEFPLYCCADENIKLFNTSVLLGQMGKRETLITVWKLIRGNKTNSIKERSPVLTSKSKMSRFNRQGYLVTLRAQNNEKLFDLVVRKYMSYSIHHLILLSLVFLTIIVFLRLKKRLLLGDSLENV